MASPPGSLSIPRASAAAASSRAVSSSGGAGSVRASSDSAPNARPVVRSTRSVRGSKARRSNLDDALGEEVQHPVGLDARAETDDRGASGQAASSCLAIFDDVHRHQPLARLLEAQLGAAARREQSRLAAGFAPPGDAIGERREDRDSQRLQLGRGVEASAAAVERGAELPPDATHLLDRAGVQLQPAQQVGAKAARVGLPIEIDQIGHVGSALEPRAGGAAERRPSAGANVALANQRGGQGGGLASAAHLPFDHQPRQSGMGGEAEHAPADVGEIARRADRPQPPEELARGAPGRGRRWLQPAERVSIHDAERPQGHRHVGQIDARDLGWIVGRTLIEVVLGVKAQRASGARSSGASGALVGGGAADLGQRQRRQARPGRVRGDPRQPGIHHRHHAVDRHRRFGDVRRQDHLAPSRRPHGAGLFLERHLAVQGKNGQLGCLGELGQRSLRPADLGGAGEKDQQIAVGLLAQELPDRPRNPPLERAVVGGLRHRQVLDGHVEHPPFASHGGRPAGIAGQKRAHRFGLQRGRHGHHGELGAGPFPQPSQPGERQIGGHVPLVKLVEHDGRDAPQLGIGEQAPHEQPLGHEPQPGPGAAGLVEADAVADDLADPLPALGGHPSSGQARRQPPGSRTKFPGAGQAGVEQGAGDAGGLPGAGGSLDDHGAIGLHRPDDGRDGIVDGQRRQAGASARR